MPRLRRRPFGALAAAAVVVALAPLGATASAVEAQGPETACSPTPENRPVCASGAELQSATFLDPTARVTSPGNVHLAPQVYVGPFAVLAASAHAPITMGAESNVQDNVRVIASAWRRAAAQAALAEAGLEQADGVQMGERVILAHGSEVRGPARLGVDSSVGEGGGDEDDESDASGLDVEAVALGEETEDSGVFLSFGAQVDGAIIERDAQLGALSRVGPGVTLHSGFVVLPGKNVTRQEEADDPALGKVRPLTEADALFNRGVVEVNVGLAREYSRLAREDASAVRGINVDPGGNPFDESRDLPTLESDLCTGPEAEVPDFRNRIIGDVCFEDSLDDLDAKMGANISIRADEGGPFGIGVIDKMDDRVIFHALEGNDLAVGDRVSYGDRVVVHGGGRPQIDPTTGLAAPTVVGNDVRLGARAVVFRSMLRNDTQVGFKSAVVGSETAVGQVIPDRTIYANDKVFGPVEW
ncbi:MAG: acetyltransferase [Actinomycetota bacterium]|nr:acetyltransferase [Actinomycetota bacterium]